MVYMLLGDGFEETEAIAPCDILRRGEVDVKLVSVSGQPVMGAHGIPVTADLMMEDVDAEAPEMIVIPGGWGGVKSIEANEAACRLVERVWQNGGYVAAICAGPTALAKLHITDGKKATVYPGLEDMMGSAVMQPACSVVCDGKLITGEAPGAAVPFGFALLEALKGSEKACAVSDAMVIR